MTILSPGEVSVLLDDVRRLASRLDDWYAWLHPSALERRVGGNRPAAQVCAGCGGVGCERCDGADRSDDIAAVLVSTGPARAKLEQTATLIARAVADLTGAGNMLGQIEGLIDAGADRTLERDGRLRLRPALAREVMEALDAKARRVARGELMASPAERAAQGKLRDRLARQTTRSAK